MCIRDSPEAEGTLIVESTCQKPEYTITGIAGKKGFVAVSIDTVSYTHLDVYKRQLMDVRRIIIMAARTTEVAMVSESESMAVACMASESSFFPI